MIITNNQGILRYIPKGITHWYEGFLWKMGDSHGRTAPIMEYAAPSGIVKIGSGRGAIVYCEHCQSGMQRAQACRGYVLQMHPTALGPNSEGAKKLIDALRSMYKHVKIDVFQTKNKSNVPEEKRQADKQKEACKRPMQLARNAQ